VISARRVNAGIACLTKLEITPPSFSNHSRYGTPWNGVFPLYARLHCVGERSAA
jgi:hypothetical protein